MTPPKFGTPGQYVRVTRQGQRRKERMREPENIVELEDVTTSETESIILTWVEEETSTTTQGEVGKSFWDPR
jgi:predicted HTH transcriptional regulator